MTSNKKIEKEKEEKYSDIQNELNLSIETSNFERAIILCKNFYFFFHQTQKHIQHWLTCTLNNMIYQMQ